MLVKELAAAVNKKCKASTASNVGGVVINTFGWIKGEGYVVFVCRIFFFWKRCRAVERREFYFEKQEESCYALNWKQKNRKKARKMASNCCASKNCWNFCILFSKQNIFLQNCRPSSSFKNTFQLSVDGECSRCVLGGRGNCARSWAPVQWASTWPTFVCEGKNNYIFNFLIHLWTLGYHIFGDEPITRGTLHLFFFIKFKFFFIKFRVFSYFNSTPLGAPLSQVRRCGKPKRRIS